MLCLGGWTRWRFNAEQTKEKRGTTVFLAKRKVALAVSLPVVPTSADEIVDHARTNKKLNYECHCAENGSLFEKYTLIIVINATTRNATRTVKFVK